MKAAVFTQAEDVLVVVAYEKGDEPDDAVDLHPVLINEWQKAHNALTEAETAINLYLTETDQR